MLTPESFICEYFTNPIGIDVSKPRVSWQSSAEQRGARQTAYQIWVGESPAALEDRAAGKLWDSGKVMSDSSLHIPDAGMALQAGQRCYWQVRVWDEAGYDDSDWRGVRQFDHPKAIIVAQVAPFIRRFEEIRPIEILHSPKGATILDFGQNMVRWVQMRVCGPAGTIISLRHAEILDQQGNLYTENLRTADQLTRYILKGVSDADEVFEPHFSFQGFRYVAVEGFPGQPTLDHFTGIVLHSDMPTTSTFKCSNQLINQLQHNIVWGQKGNFVDVPTDCPPFLLTAAAF